MDSLGSDGIPVGDELSGERDQYIWCVGIILIKKQFNPIFIYSQMLRLSTARGVTCGLPGLDPIRFKDCKSFYSLKSSHCLKIKSI